MTTGVDDASVASTDFKVIILAQEGGHSSIDPNFLLLDSQSTVELFSNSALVDNVRPAARPIQVHCNKGIMPTSNDADFGSNEVYLNQDGIANVLLLHLLAKKHHIMYGSCDSGGGVFKVHTTDGLLELKPTNKGLHALNLSNNPKAAHVLVTSTPPNDDHPHVNTVQDNYEGFTKKQIQRAREACCIMLMTGIPTEHGFKCMVRLNQLQDCPITHKDIKIAHAIYGCDLAYTRGKTVWHKPDCVETNYVKIPMDLSSFHKKVTLVEDVFFFNSVPFLILASRNINLITIEHAPKQTASKLGHLLQRIFHVYTKAGFHVQVILMDNEFEKVWDHVPFIDMNIPAVAEHVAEIERHICMIKERACAILCTLPYKSLPQQILI
jgi:hypothetical protein